MMSREQKKRRFTRNEVIWAGAATVAGVAASLAALVSLLLIINFLQVRATQPLDNPQLLELHRQLAEASNPDPELIRQIEALDLLARKALFTSQAHIKLGAYVLIGGAAVLLAALRVAAKANPNVPMPTGETAYAAKRYWLARRNVRATLMVSGAFFVFAGLVAGFSTHLNIPAPHDATPVANEQQQAGPAYPDWQTMQKNWPSFRGPGATGVAFFTTAPTEWDVASGKNIKWKMEVPLSSPNSPVVWDNKVFLSGATEATREIYCLDTESGSLLWRHTVRRLAGAPEERPRISDDANYAAPTMVAHGDRVCAIFANGDLVCLDFNGDMIWGKNIGVPDNHYGHASSLLAFNNLLFVQYDQRVAPRLFALDLSDGHPVWTADRKKISWASPIWVMTAFGPQLVLASEKDVDAYDPVTGKLAWTIDCLDGEVAPSPACGGGMFFAANDLAYATAIQITEENGALKAKALWQWDEALPDVSSPVGTDTHFYIATSRGEIVCLDNKTGATAWLHEFDDGFFSSPIVVGDRIYVFDKKGLAHIFKTGPEFSSIADCPMGEVVHTTPAFLDGRIYVRTEKQLFCIAE